ncbi:hypothetical protein [Lewinella sp. IMCC34183]|uniref:hypothetical protein n=1 Tax=Lewinella sp. IMCC34183 TaxID=2248762 RepID=UPI0013008654|nr:hypothetical protein [Lewinella sp. IMCC34183]
MDRFRGVSRVSEYGELVWHLDDRYLQPSESNPVRYAYRNSYTGHLEVSGSSDFSLMEIDTDGNFVRTIPLGLKHDNAISVGQDIRLAEVSGYATEVPSGGPKYFRLALLDGGKLRTGIGNAPVLPAAQRRYYFDHTLLRWKDSIYYTRPLLNTLYTVDTASRELIPKISWTFDSGQAESNPFEDRQVEDAFEYMADRNLVQPGWVVGDEDILLTNYDYNYQNYLAVSLPDTTLLNTAYLQAAGVLLPVPSIYTDGYFAAVYPRAFHELLQTLPSREPDSWRAVLQQYFSNDPPPGAGGMLMVLRLK